MDASNREEQILEGTDSVVESKLSSSEDRRFSNIIIGFFELIYGVLFEPAKTFRIIGQNPPIIKVVIIFSIIQALSMLLFVLGGVSSDNYLPAELPGMTGVVKAVLFGMAFGGFVFAFVKWFLYSCILYFLSELLGGTGKAMGVLAATGLASIPTMLLSPVQLLLILLGNNWWTYLMAGLLMIATVIWFIFLLVIGLKETQHLSRSKALAVIFIPVVTIIVLFLLLLVVAGSLVAPMLMYVQELGGI